MQTSHVSMGFCGADSDEVDHEIFTHLKRRLVCLAGAGHVFFESRDNSRGGLLLCVKETSLGADGTFSP